MKLFEVTFETWENDGDDYNTLSIFTTNKKDVNFYIALAQQFFSTHDYRNSHGLGNDSYADETLEEVVQDLIEEHPKMSKELKNEWLNVIGKPQLTYRKLCAEILSVPIQYEEYGFCRVMEKVEVNEIALGTWININNTLAVLVGYKNNEVQYRYSVHACNEKGEVDIFKIEWELDSCQLNEFYIETKPDEISLKVVEFFK